MVSNDAELLVSEPQAEIINSPKLYNLFLAGVGSGKSFCMGILSSHYIINFPNATGLICANTYGQLSHSTLVQVKKVWAQLGLHEDVHYVSGKKPPNTYKRIGEPLEKYTNVISFCNGATVFLGSLDNYTAIDGMEVSWAMLDETKDTKEEAVKDVIIARLREGKIYIDSTNELWDHQPPRKKVKGFNPLYIFTSPAKVSWLNEMFHINDNLDEIHKHIFDPDDYYVGDFENKRVVISSTFHNEHNLPDTYIQSRRDIWDATPGMTDMMLFASPTGKTGGEWYANFKRETHVVAGLEPNPELPIHATFDFNVIPYMSALDIQMEYVKKTDTTYINVIREYAFAHPMNTTGEVCDEMIFNWAGVHTSCFYYGDATGKARNTVSHKTNYDVIRAKLEAFLFQGSNCVPRSNPPIDGRRVMINNMFTGNHNVVVRVHPSCKNFINDMEMGKTGPNGEYVKEKATDPETKKSFEKVGHHSDCFIYFCWKHFNYLTKVQ